MEPIIGDASGNGAAPLPGDLIKDSDTAGFMADVVEASKEVPVIVDFWAEWCGPCKQLGPAIEKVVTEAAGAVRLVKINVDENQQLAQQLRVQSIPMVYGFSNGQPVDVFTGALPEFQREIRYENVTFEFRPGEPVLQGISLEIRRGQRAAFVGPSGAGKTTLMDLLLRFYDPGAGRIAVDGLDLRDCSVASVRSQIALVSQEVLLFNASVRENLLYARPAAPREDVERAARAAGAAEFIAAMPQGYETVIGERGVKLSGGERQRLSIARAFLKDAPILVLDEATAALDAASEAVIQTALEQLMANRTVLIIAHRLATVRNADFIAVLEGGKVVERGSHEELLAQGGLYRRLCDLQLRDPAA